MKRIISIVMTVILTALTFSACGESRSGNKQESVAEAAAETDTNLQAKAKKTLKKASKATALRAPDIW